MGRRGVGTAGRTVSQVAALALWAGALAAQGPIPLRPVPLGATPTRTSGVAPLPHRIVPVETICPEEHPHGPIPIADSAQVDSTYHEDNVDRPPELISQGHARYPRDLEFAGVGGKVTFSYVVDTTGHPEACSFHVHASPDPRFEVAAFRMVLDNLFRPGEIHGRKVRVLVFQSVTFNP